MHLGGYIMNARFSKWFLSVVLVVAVVGVTPVVLRVPLANGLDGPTITVNLTPYPDLHTPILTIGEAGTWESSGVGYPRVVYRGGIFHMLYLGWTNEAGDVHAAVGYATSEDGLNWTKYESNPVFAPDESIAPQGMLNLSVMLDGETWVMYFGQFKGAYSPSKTILRATASSPAGPWTVDAELVALAPGGIADWDWFPPAVESVMHTDAGYIMYYVPIVAISGDGISYGGGGIGRATSTDGITWTKYNDPATATGDYAVSDPVFVNNPDDQAWDSSHVGAPVVRFSEDGWEMFYYGYSGLWYSIGYATSPDGITWTRYGDAPVVTAPETGFAPGSVVVLDATYYLYYGFSEASSSSEIAGQIGVATDTVTRE
jgi:hypothetical protein